MSKQQLADKAGVSLNTLNKWCKPIQKDLLKLGMIPGARMLPPVVVRVLELLKLLTHRIEKLKD